MGMLIAARLVDGQVVRARWNPKTDKADVIIDGQPVDQIDMSGIDEAEHGALVDALDNHTRSWNKTTIAELI